MRWLGYVVAGALLAGCHTDPDCAAPTGPLDAASYGAESEAVAAADAFIQRELGAARAANGWDPARLDAAARTMGFSGAGEAAALVSRGCLEPSGLAHFAAARGLSAAAAGGYLRTRFDLRVCPD
jgi:hypothetical protein